MEIKNFRGSNYNKKYNPYFWTKVKYGREPDTIIFWYAITPTKRISKYWNTLRFNAERNTTTEYKKDKIKNIKLSKLPKGYIWSEPLLYSGIL